MGLIQNFNQKDTHMSPSDYGSIALVLYAGILLLWVAGWTSRYISARRLDRRFGEEEYAVHRVRAARALMCTPIAPLLLIAKIVIEIRSFFTDVKSDARA